MTSSYGNILGTPRDQIPTQYEQLNYELIDTGRVDAVEKQNKDLDESAKFFFEGIARSEELLAKQNLDVIGQLAEFSQSAARFKAAFQAGQDKALADSLAFDRFKKVKDEVNKQLEQKNKKIDDAQEEVDANYAKLSGDAVHVLENNQDPKDKTIAAEALNQNNQIVVTGNSLAKTMVADSKLVDSMILNHISTPEVGFFQAGDRNEALRIYREGENRALFALVVDLRRKGFDINSGKFFRLYNRHVRPILESREKDQMAVWDRNFQNNVLSIHKENEKIGALRSIAELKTEINTGKIIGSDTLTGKNGFLNTMARPGEKKLTTLFRYFDHLESLADDGLLTEENLSKLEQALVSLPDINGSKRTTFFDSNLSDDNKQLIARKIEQISSTIERKKGNQIEAKSRAHTLTFIQKHQKIYQKIKSEQGELEAQKYLDSFKGDNGKGKIRELKDEFFGNGDIHITERDLYSFNQYITRLTGEENTANSAVGRKEEIAEVAQSYQGVLKEKVTTAINNAVIANKDEKQEGFRQLVTSNFTGIINLRFEKAYKENLGELQEKLATESDPEKQKQIKDQYSERIFKAVIKNIDADALEYYNSVRDGKDLTSGNIKTESLRAIQKQLSNNQQANNNFLIAKTPVGPEAIHLEAIRVGLVKDKFADIPQSAINFYNLLKVKDKNGDIMDGYDVAVQRLIATGGAVYADGSTGLKFRVNERKKYLTDDVIKALNKNWSHNALYNKALDGSIEKGDLAKVLRAVQEPGATAGQYTDNNNNVVETGLQEMTVGQVLEGINNGTMVKLGIYGYSAQEAKILIKQMKDANLLTDEDVFNEDTQTFIAIETMRQHANKRPTSINGMLNPQDPKSNWLRLNSFSQEELKLLKVVYPQLELIPQNSWENLLPQVAKIFVDEAEKKRNIQKLTTDASDVTGRKNVRTSLSQINNLIDSQNKQKREFISNYKFEKSGLSKQQMGRKNVPFNIRQDAEGEWNKREEELTGTTLQNLQENKKKLNAKLLGKQGPRTKKRNKQKTGN